MSRGLLVLLLAHLASCGGRQGLDQPVDVDAAVVEDAEAALEAPSNGCALDRLPPLPPAPSCGDLPAIFASWCGCQDAIDPPLCRSGMWICPEQKKPRLTCGSCRDEPIP